MWLSLHVCSYYHNFRSDHLLTYSQNTKVEFEEFMFDNGIQNNTTFKLIQLSTVLHVARHTFQTHIKMHPYEPL